MIINVKLKLAGCIRAVCTLTRRPNLDAPGRVSLLRPNVDWTDNKPRM